MVRFFGAVRYVFFLIYFFSFSLNALECVVSLSHEKGFSCLDTYIPETLFIKKVVSSHDFIGLAQERMYTRNEIKEVLRYALKSKKFDVVKVQSAPVVGGYVLQFDFSMRQIFSRVVLEGLFFW
jgi:hypothetical protein